MTLAIAVGMWLPACSASAGVGGAVSALWDGTSGSYVDHADSDTPDHDVVVSLASTATGPTACTGVLVSPRLVLTAASCKLPAKAGATPFVRVGASSSGFAQIVQASSFLTFAADPAAEPSLSGQDVGLVVLRGFVLDKARPQHPSFVAPNPTAQPSTSGLEPFSNIVFTGWSPLDAGAGPSAFASHRQVMTVGTQQMWRYGRWSPAKEPFWVVKPYSDDGTLKYGLAAGDNGAPLFTADATGSWSVIGIASIIGDPIDPNVRAQALPALGQDPTAGARCATAVWSTPGSVTTCDAWVDVTATAVRGWISTAARDTTRSARWLKSHPLLSTGMDRWIGDVDYFGACDRTRDPDCDHVYTINPDGSARDNCPSTYNPDQNDSRDSGQGDACCVTPCGSACCSSTEYCDQGSSKCQPKRADNELCDTADMCMHGCCWDAVCEPVDFPFCAVDDDM